MKYFQIKLSIFLLLFSFFTVNAQVQALFNSKTQLEIWRKDGNWIPLQWGEPFDYPTLFVLMNNLNERPESGNTDPDYVAPEVVDYNSIETKFNWVLTKVLQSIMVIYG
jgi:phospholipase A1